MIFRLEREQREKQAKAEALQRQREQAALLERCKLKQHLAISKQGTLKRDPSRRAPRTQAEGPTPLMAGVERASRRVYSPQQRRVESDRVRDGRYAEDPLQQYSVAGDESTSGNDDGIWSRERRTLILDALTQTLPQTFRDGDSERSDDDELYNEGTGIFHRPGVHAADDSADSNEAHIASMDKDRTWAYARTSINPHIGSVFAEWSKGAKANSLLQTSNELALALLENASNPLRKHTTSSRSTIQVPCAGLAHNGALNQVVVNRNAIISV
jgi:hypothetical protein